MENVEIKEEEGENSQPRESCLPPSSVYYTTDTINTEESAESKICSNLLKEDLSSDFSLIPVKESRAWFIVLKNERAVRTRQEVTWLSINSGYKSNSFKVDGMLEEGGKDGR